MADPEKVTFAGTQETALATLYGRALESRLPNSVLGDWEADAAVQRIDYDFSKLGITRRDQKATAIRATAYDHWVSRFLETGPECTVLNLDE
jgi:O-methyltransferase involved in polyketide biosynthesis